MVTKEDWRAKQVRFLSQPLDLEDLVRKGILEKKGAWYRILKFKSIPEHVWANVSGIKRDPHGSMIKFAKVSKSSRAKFEKVVGKLPKS